MTDQPARPAPNAANRVLARLRQARQRLIDEQNQLHLQQVNVQGGISAINELIDDVQEGRVVGLPKPEEL